MNPLEHDWTIEEVYYDGIYQTEWKGLTLSMSSKGERHGIYNLPDTPYDTIWPASGTWRLSDEVSSVIFNETTNLQMIVQGVYSISETQFQIEVWLPWTQRPCTLLPW